MDERTEAGEELIRCLSAATSLSSKWPTLLSDPSYSEAESGAPRMRYLEVTISCQICMVIFFLT